MDGDGYIVVYDILRDGIGVAEVVGSLGWLAGFCVAVWLLVWEYRRRKPVAWAWALVVLPFLGLVGYFGIGNVWDQHFRCIAWARSGEFKVVEGRVTYFDPLELGKKGPERFTVEGITFEYMDSYLGQGGFRYSFGPNGPLQQGVQVRVSYREGRILRLEILHE
jgi:hypothetical protein